MHHFQLFLKHCKVLQDHYHYYCTVIRTNTSSHTTITTTITTLFQCVSKGSTDNLYNFQTEKPAQTSARDYGGEDVGRV